VDSLEAELLLCQLKMPHLQAKLQEILDLSRMFLRCDVLEAPLEEKTLCGMTAEEIRHRSHFPQKYYNQPHFMPEVTDGERILYLNKLRTLVRETELAANQALPHRQDILKAMNRMSSMVYLLMIEEKAKR
jgi:ethanolamine utilization cobalamin adenosyltransferase